MEHTQGGSTQGSKKVEEVGVYIPAPIAHWLLKLSVPQNFQPLLSVKSPQAKHSCLPQEARGIYRKGAGDVGKVPTAPSVAPDLHPHWCSVQTFYTVGSQAGLSLVQDCETPLPRVLMTPS